jgi:hypothetical protein
MPPSRTSPPSLLLLPPRSILCSTM